MYRGCCLIACADVLDVEAKAMQFARIIKQHHQDFFRNVQHCFLEASDDYHRAVAKNAREQLGTLPAIKLSF